jgi:hypothetical protein
MAAAWWYATPPYDEFLCKVLRRFGESVQAVDRSVHVLRADAPPMQIPADQLTYNVILFAGLVAAAPPRRAWRLLVAVLVLLAFHLLALAATIEASYATRAGAWSKAHYSPLAQDLWTSLDFLYRLGGMFAIAFVCWYAAIGAREPQPGTSRKSGRVEPARRRTASSRR